MLRIRSLLSIFSMAMMILGTAADMSASQRQAGTETSRQSGRLASYRSKQARERMAFVYWE